MKQYTLLMKYCLHFLTWKPDLLYHITVQSSHVCPLLVTITSRSLN